MGLQAIEAGPEFRSSVFPMDQDTGGLPAAHNISFQRVGASIALSPAHWLPESKMVGNSRGKRSVVAPVSVAVAACALWLFTAAAWDNALCGESDARDQAFVVAEKGHKTAQANTKWDESLLVSLLVETTVFEQAQILKHGRQKVESLAGGLPLTQPSDAPQGKVAQAPQSTPAAARERKQLLEQEWFARALTSSLRGELDEVRSAADAEIKQNQALDQERDRADALARELASLRAELETAQGVRLETAQTTAVAKIEQEQAFAKEREKTETLARELAAARKEVEALSALLAAAHADALHVTETSNANAAEHERTLISERDRADALARELTSARNELEAGNRQIAASNSARAPHSRASAADRSQERMAKPYSRAIEGEGRPPEQISGKAVAFTSPPSSVSELPRPETPPAAREAASDLVPKVAMGIERSTAPHAVALPLADEQRMLARAATLLGQADISGARPSLQRALENGSARAAFYAGRDLRRARAAIVARKRNLR
jgi:hypothetical protein